MSDDEIAEAVRDIAAMLSANLEHRRRWWLEWRHKVSRLICDGCGCLCWPDEPCPGCRARRRLAKEAA